jgi:hypothetical protein
MAPMAAVPPPAAQAEYPPCTRTVRDQCTNPGEMAGRKKRKRS